ncbi:hypothetical protein H8I91_09205 [Serratia fonticola]|uniref:hypothetical protein n=1 Tax=Serratia fonticola TaxID=47917 RepID=UPI001645C809|nr:hypothetical protein [Serratia fonticola]MBC3250438.1 hypothetical protein [Serratia fonticola]
MTTPSQVPVPSEKPQDLLFNAGKIDEFVNSVINQYIDRFGAAHLTIAGITALARTVIEQIKADGAEAVSAIGWQELGDWVVNLSITNRDQVVWYDGAWYKYIGGLPHTITGDSPESDGGVWSESNPAGVWVNIGDAALRSEIAGAGGFRLIGTVNGVNRLSTIFVQDGDRVQLLDVFGWAGVRVPTGTGILRYDANRSKSEHDGFIHFSPTVPFTTLTNYLNGVGETDVSGTGVFVRENYGNEVLLSHCGIYPLTNSSLDISTATNACTKLFNISSKGYDIYFDVDLYVADIVVTDINYVIKARFGNKLMLGRNGRILKLQNTTASGSVTLISPRFDANGFSSIEDGGLLQSNNVKKLEIKDITLSGFVRASFQANGIATTGIGCHTILHDPDMSNCGSQLVYTQTTKVTLINPNLHDSPGHAIAIVNCDDFYCVGGIATACDHGILTYSTPDYRGNLRRFHVQGTSLRGNNKAFEISRRYETASVSQGNADVVLSDIDATGCTLASTIGNLATDNTDGFALREAFLNNVFIDNQIESHSVFGLHVIGGRNNGIKIRGKYENIEVRPGKMYGNSTTANTNCAIYLYASATGKNVIMDSFSYYGFNSFIYAEAGAVASGPIIVNNPVTDPSGMSFKVNSEFYGYVSFNSGNRLRDMSRQTWGVGRSPFYDTTLGKFVTWNGANITDMMGNVVP